MPQQRTSPLSCEMACDMNSRCWSAVALLVLLVIASAPGCAAARSCGSDGRLELHNVAIGEETIVNASQHCDISIVNATITVLTFADVVLANVSLVVRNVTCGNGEWTGAWACIVVNSELRSARRVDIRDVRYSFREIRPPGNRIVSVMMFAAPVDASVMSVAGVDFSATVVDGAGQAQAYVVWFRGTTSIAQLRFDAINMTVAISIATECWAMVAAFDHVFEGRASTLHFSRVAMRVTVTSLHSSANVAVLDFDNDASGVANLTMNDLSLRASLETRGPATFSAFSARKALHGSPGASITLQNIVAQARCQSRGDEVRALLVFAGGAVRSFAAITLRDLSLEVNASTQFNAAIAAVMRAMDEFSGDNATIIVCRNVRLDANATSRAGFAGSHVIRIEGPTTGVAGFAVSSVFLRATVRGTGDTAAVVLAPAARSQPFNGTNSTTFRMTDIIVIANVTSVRFATASVLRCGDVSGVRAVDISNASLRAAVDGTLSASIAVIVLDRALSGIHDAERTALRVDGCSVVGSVRTPVATRASVLVLRVATHMSVISCTRARIDVQVSGIAKLLEVDEATGQPKRPPAAAAAEGGDNETASPALRARCDMCRAQNAGIAHPRGVPHAFS
jgi:hypothetical protein